MGSAQEVVAGAVIRDGRVLVARRAWPPELAGLWEFPGGGVEPDETSHQALVREIDEELGIHVIAGEQIGTDVAIPGGRVLRLRRAELISGSPQLREHTAVRWVDAAKLHSLDLVPADRAWLSDLAVLLR